MVPIMVRWSDRFKKTLKNGYLFFQVTEPESYNVLQVELAYTKSVVQDVIEEVEIESFENLPIDLDDTANRWTDLHSDGIPCILTEQGGGWFCKSNLSWNNVKHVNINIH